METLFFGIVMVILLKIAWIDFKEKYIYDLDILIATGIITFYNIYKGDFLDSVFGGITGFLIGFLIFGMAYIIYEEEAFGFGDVLLLCVIGQYLGSYLFISYFAITTIFFGMLALCAILVKPGLRKAALPMAPVYVAGLLLFRLASQPTVYDVFYNIYIVMRTLCFGY